MRASPEPRAVQPHVMHVALSLDPGGTERLIVELAKRAVGTFRVTVCCLDRPGEWARELEDRGIEVFALDRQPGFHPRLGHRIAQHASRRGVNVLHCHHYTPFVYGGLARIETRGLSVLYTEHGRLSDASPTLKRRLVTPLLARLANEMYAVSEDLRRYLVSAGFPAARVGVITNGIHVGPPPDADAVRRAKQLLGAVDDRPIAAAIGRLDPVKDLSVLLDAFDQVSRREGRLVIIGDGPEARHLRSHATARGLDARVRFLGYRQDVRAMYPGVDVLVNTSISEGISLTLLEAMAACVPIVATAVGGTPEVVVDGVTGILVPPRSPAAVALALDELLQSPDRRKQMSIAGRARVEALFTFERMASLYFAAYVRLAHTQAPADPSRHPIVRS
jgi:glycosyltransferase involved in cell wall biosynthesis